MFPPYFHPLFPPRDGPTASFTSLLGGTWVVAQADIHRACFALLSDFSAKVVLFPRGGCSFYIKGDNVVNSKAAAGVWLCLGCLLGCFGVGVGVDAWLGART